MYFDIVIMRFVIQIEYSLFLALLLLIQCLTTFSLMIGNNITALKFLAGPLSFPGFGRETKIPTPVSKSLCFSKVSFMIVGS